MRCLQFFVGFRVELCMQFARDGIAVKIVRIRLPERAQRRELGAPLGDDLVFVGGQRTWRGFVVHQASLSWVATFAMRSKS